MRWTTAIPSRGERALRHRRRSQGELVVASPLQAGTSAPSFRAAPSRMRGPDTVYRARVADGFVFVEIAEVPTTCCYCGIGCGVLASVSGDTITSVRGDPATPPTSAAVHQGPVVAQGRSFVSGHVLRRYTAKRKTWDETLSFPCRALREDRREHGPDSVGVYVSGQFPPRTIRLQTSSPKADRDQQHRYQLAPVPGIRGGRLQADARRGRAPGLYEDVDSAECVFIAGSTPPGLTRFFSGGSNGRSRGTSSSSTRERPRPRARRRCICRSRPGSDVALFNGMLRVMLREGWCDESYSAAYRKNLNRLRRS